MKHKRNLKALDVNTRKPISELKYGKKLIKAIKWVNSLEGKRKIKESQVRADKSCKKLKEAIKVDPKSLDIPMGI